MRQSPFFEILKETLIPLVEFKISCLNPPNSEQLIMIGGTLCFLTWIKTNRLEAASICCEPYVYIQIVPWNISIL